MSALDATKCTKRRVMNRSKCRKSVEGAGEHGTSPPHSCQALCTPASGNNFAQLPLTHKGRESDRIRAPHSAALAFATQVL